MLDSSKYQFIPANYLPVKCQPGSAGAVWVHADQ